MLGLSLYFHFGVYRPTADEHAHLIFEAARVRAEERLAHVTEKVESLLNFFHFQERDAPFLAEEVRKEPFRLKEIFVREPLLGAVTLVDDDGRSWGFGRFGDDGWVLVRPDPDADGGNGDESVPAHISIEFDHLGRKVQGGEKVVAPFRLTSPWFRVVAEDSNRILWTEPFTSTVLGEPVMSAAIRSHAQKNKGMAVHVRISDLSFVATEFYFLRMGRAALIDKQGRLIAMSDRREDAKQAVGERTVQPRNFLLLKSLSVARLDPFSSLMESWLDAQKPLQRLHGFTSPNGERYLGSVSMLALGGTELYLLLVAPEEEFVMNELSFFEIWGIGAFGLSLIAASLSIRRLSKVLKTGGPGVGERLRERSEWRCERPCGAQNCGNGHAIGVAD